MHQTCHAVYQKSVTAQLPTWLRRRSRAPSAEVLDAALMLLRLDLDPLHPLLASLYAAAARGRPPFAPRAVLPALLLFTLLRYESLTVFAQDLRRCPRLALLAGFPAYQTPSVGAFYGFLDRLENGPYQAPCPHRVAPAQLRALSPTTRGKETKRSAPQIAPATTRLAHPSPQCRTHRPRRATPSTGFTTAPGRPALPPRRRAFGPAWFARRPAPISRVWRWRVTRDGGQSDRTPGLRVPQTGALPL